MVDRLSAHPILAAGRGTLSEERGGDVHIEVGVDPRGDPQWQCGHRHPFVGKRVGGTTPAGTTDRTAMGL